MTQDEIKSACERWRVIMDRPNVNADTLRNELAQAVALIEKLALEANQEHGSED